ncbi:MAG: hypothetical protein IJT79_06395 [Ruminococcus sp.]|nr:hypothetical protein [Ruminococcus sp.]
MNKRIITLFLAAIVVLFSSCMDFTTTVSETIPKKNTNKSNSIKINKKKIDEDIVLSPYYEPVELDTGYNCLDTNDEKRLYNGIVEHAADYDDGTKDSDGNYVITTFTLDNCSLTSKEVSKVFFAIELDKPDFFWLANPYSYSVVENSFSLTISSPFTYEQYEKRRGQLNSVINSVLKGLKPKMSELERELYIHDYLVKNCVYKDKADDNDNRYTIYGCLVEQSAVCEGYKNAFQQLLAYCGIKSYGISGSLDNSENIDHVWNAVRIDGEYYHTDVTWDDAEDMVMYDYFNLTTKQIKRTHSIAEMFDDIPDSTDFSGDTVKSYNLIVPDCTSDKYNYYKYFGSKIQSMADNTLAEDLAKAAERHDDFFYISVGKKLNYTTTYDQLFSDDIFLFAGYIDDANSILGSDVLQTSVSVLKRKWLRAIIVALKYN